jgi:hypothetical protein
MPGNFQHQDWKLVAAASADRVAFANAGLSLRHLLQHAIADIMPVRVIDALELVGDRRIGLAND